MQGLWAGKLLCTLGIQRGLVRLLFGNRLRGLVRVPFLPAHCCQNLASLPAWDVMRDFRSKKPPGAGIHFEVQGRWKGAGVKAQEREAREGA